MSANITLTGTVYPTSKDGKDQIEVRFTPNGKAVVNFNVSDSHRVKNQNGEWVKDERRGKNGTSYYRVTQWGDAAETTMDALRAAAASNGGWCRVLVTGRLSVDHWTSRDGNDGVTASVVADTVAVIPPRNGGGSAAPSGNVSFSAPAGGSAGDAWATGGAGFDDAPPW